MLHKLFVRKSEKEHYFNCWKKWLRKTKTKKKTTLIDTSVLLLFLISLINNILCKGYLTKLMIWERNQFF